MQWFWQKRPTRGLLLYYAEQVATSVQIGIDTEEMLWEAGPPSTSRPFRVVAVRSKTEEKGLLGAQVACNESLFGSLPDASRLQKLDCLERG